MLVDSGFVITTLEFQINPNCFAHRYEFENELGKFFNQLGFDACLIKSNLKDKRFIFVTKKKSTI